MSFKKRCRQLNAFSLLELILVLILLSSISYIVIKNKKIDSLNIATNKMILYLKQTRLQALINDKYNHNDLLWHKQRWTLKFFRCKKSVGGIYYSIYSDMNKTGHPSANETLKDPLNKKNIYSSNQCKENEFNSKYVLLTKEYGIEDVKVSCNSTTSLGQISFGSDGRVYSKLSNKNSEYYEYAINEPCIVTMYHKSGTFAQISIENNTGYISKRE